MISPLVTQQLAVNFGGHTVLLVDNNAILIDSKPVSPQGIASPEELEGFQKLDAGRQAGIISALTTLGTAIIGGTIVETPVQITVDDTIPGVEAEPNSVVGDLSSNADLSENLSESAVVQAEEAPAEGQPEN